MRALFSSPVRLEPRYCDMLSTEYDLSSFPAGSVKFQFEVLRSLTFVDEVTDDDIKQSRRFWGFPSNFECRICHDSWWSRCDERYLNEGENKWPAIILVTWSCRKLLNHGISELRTSQSFTIGVRHRDFSVGGETMTLVAWEPGTEIVLTSPGAFIHSCISKPVWLKHMFGWLS